MVTYDLFSAKTGKTYKVEFDSPPTEQDVDEAVAYLDSAQPQSFLSSLSNSAEPIASMPFAIVCGLWLFAATIAIVDIRLQQAKREGASSTMPEMSPGVAVFFHLAEWALFIVAMVMNWKLGLIICFGLFVLKAAGLLEGIGSLLARMFAKR
jgi:hypothetical protein